MVHQDDGPGEAAIDGNRNGHRLDRQPGGTGDRRIEALVVGDASACVIPDGCSAPGGVATDTDGDETDGTDTGGSTTDTTG